MEVELYPRGYLSCHLGWDQLSTTSLSRTGVPPPVAGRSVLPVTSVGVREAEQLSLMASAADDLVTARGRVRAACARIEDDPAAFDLTALAAAVHCSARQLQRDFDAVVGVSPRAYAQAIRTDAARSALRSADSVAGAINDAGYGSVRAFYEEAGRRLGMTPSEYANGAHGLPLLWARTPSVIGTIRAVASPRGLCSVRIGASAEADDLATEFPNAELREDPVAMRDVMTALRAIARGVPSAADLPLDVTGTALQAKVWKALREIPAGQTRTYAEVAAIVGEPRAVRGVASACARNKVALTVPCHRVIRGDGSLAGYAWGLEVKASLLEAEHAAAQP